MIFECQSLSGSNPPNLTHNFHPVCKNLALYCMSESDPDIALSCFLATRPQNGILELTVVSSTTLSSNLPLAGNMSLFKKKKKKTFNATFALER